MEKDALTSAPQKEDASTQEAAAQPKSDAEETLAQAEAVAEREAPRGTALTWSAVLVAVATLGLLGLHWFDTRERFAGLQAEVAQRLASSDAAGGEARMLAKQGQEATATLQARLIDLEAKLETVRVKLRRAETALDRASGFQERLDGRLQCPKCWVVSEVVTDLAPVSSDGGETRVRCGVCGTEFVV